MLPDKMPALSISIVNWNTKYLLRDCLKAIYENAPQAEYEVFVADNASADGSAGMVKRRLGGFAFDIKRQDLLKIIQLATEEHRTKKQVSLDDLEKVRKIFAKGESGGKL